MTNSFGWQAAWGARGVMGLMLLLLIASESRAELIGAGETRYRVRPIQDLILAPNTTFNPTDDEVYIADVEGIGFSRFDRLAQVGTEIQLINGRFSGTGFNAALGNFTLTTGGPDFDPMTMLLTNVQQDDTDPGYASGDPSSLSFANVRLTVANFGVRLDDLGVDLEVRDPFSFVGTFDGLPPSRDNLIVDEIFGDNDRLAVYIAGTNDVVGWSANRRLLSAVPEPSSLAFLAVATVTGACRWRRRSRARASAT